MMKCFGNIWKNKKKLYIDYLKIVNIVDLLLFKNSDSD
jgi:hypothetical protein